MVARDFYSAFRPPFGVLSSFGVVISTKKSKAFPKIKHPFFPINAVSSEL